MNIAFGHDNMDMDCLGSLLLIKKLFPDYQLVKSHLVHPVARKLYNIYQEYFEFISPYELKGEDIENIIIVDTCSAGRVKEYFRHIRNPHPKIRIIDHHNLESCDILGAEVEGASFGATVTYLGKMAMEKGVTLSSDEATIALSGIYADTGRLIYENVCREDYEVSAYLLDMGASLKLVKSFLESIIEDDQILVLNQLFLILKPQIIIQGHSVLVSCLELQDNVNGLSAVIDKIMEVENPDAYFAFFSIPKKNTVLLIARSQKTQIDLDELFQRYGGGGHQAAASLRVTKRNFEDFVEEFLSYLEKSLKPATRARDIMTYNIHALKEDMKLLDASVLLENGDITGAPVLNNAGELTGFLSLSDIMRGRRADQMHAPVKAYMTKNVITSSGDITIRAIEQIFYKHRINHIPIVEDGKVTGVVSYKNYLRHTAEGRF